MTDHRMGWPPLAAMIAEAFPRPARRPLLGTPRVPVDQTARAVLDRDPAKPRRIRLTDEAAAEQDDFERVHGDRGCTCFLSPPCSWCTHPGNPLNLECDDTAWEPGIEGEGQ